ncbi:GDSL-type esterase/lipase family protein [Myxococcota bacterium]|nr:GDSL-type esterase/lipase family protein [Myxococcota bacterium]
MKRRTWVALAVVLALNLGIVGLSLVFRQTVVPGWKKGPLIDPAAPYSPENAQVLFSVAACLVLDLYLVLLALWRRSRRPHVLAPWLALLVALVAAEGAVRAWLAVDMVTYFRPHPILHWVVRPDLRDFDNLTGGGRITTNHDGMRMPGTDRIREAGPGSDDVFRIVVTGDSSNFGHGVEGEEMWSAVLEDILDPLTPRQVEVINAATPGWTTYQAVEDLGLRVAAYQPDLLLAGFNNDPGPDYFHDADRVLPPGPRRELSALAWKSEVYLLCREVLLSLVRRVSPAARATYTARKAGADPKYGELSPEEAAKLVPRVPIEDFVGNLGALQDAGRSMGFGFVWIDMPVNRLQPELVERYVDWDYREAARRLGAERGFPIVEVDDRWVRQRAQDLHIVGHVFHPNAAGHRRLGQQVAADLLRWGLVPGAEGEVEIGGPPPAPTAETLRLGWSRKTPVHAHVGAVLQAMPELAAKHGLTLELSGYDGGKEQGADLARGDLDAYFSCEIPAVHMLHSRPDTRIVGTPGGLGRIAVLARRDRATRLAELSGKRVGLTAGSTPAMDWQTWGKGLGAVVVDLPTEELEQALEAGTVDAVVSWDPWIELWLQGAPQDRVVLAERPFRSVLAASVPWSLPEPPVEGQPRAARLVALVDEALAVAAADRPRWDAEVARLGGWPVEVVRAVADRNELLSGARRTLPVDRVDREALDRAAAATGAGTAGALFSSELLQARPPAGYSTPAPGKGPKPTSPPRGPPLPSSPGTIPPR